MVAGTNLIKSVDQGWLEILGGQGALITVKKGVEINQSIQIKSFNFFIFTILFVAMILLFTLS